MQCRLFKCWAIKIGENIMNRYELLLTVEKNVIEVEARIQLERKMKLSFFIKRFF